MGSQHLMNRTCVDELGLRESELVSWRLSARSTSVRRVSARLHKIKLELLFVLKPSITLADFNGAKGRENN